MRCLYILQFNSACIPFTCNYCACCFSPCLLATHKVEHPLRLSGGLSLTTVEPTRHLRAGSRRSNWNQTWPLAIAAAAAASCGSGAGANTIAAANVLECLGAAGAAEEIVGGR